jgi:ParB family chromosome partitioning protein
VPASAAGVGASGTPRNVPIEAVHPAPDQPRKHFDPEELAALAASIRTQGIIQPVIVTPAPQRGAWIIVAGERRWRAAQQAGLHELPVIVREAGDEERLELALVENIQRADLNPLEEARAYEALVRLRDYSQEELAQRVGKDRTTITNSLRLLKLPDKVQEMVRDGRLSMGHARALLGLQDPAEAIELAREVLQAKLSVRATERAVRRRNLPGPSAPPESDEAQRRRVIVAELEDRLRRRLGVRARLRGRRGNRAAGVLELPYASLDDLDRLLHLLLDSDPGRG